MPNCPYDRLQIYDGTTIYDHSLAILCDILISDVILYSYATTGNLAYVTFVSDGMMTREGFLLRYEAVGTGTQPPAPTTPMCKHYKDSTIFCFMKHFFIDLMTLLF